MVYKKKLNVTKTSLDLQIGGNSGCPVCRLPPFLPLSQVTTVENADVRLVIL